ncbi:MAG: hypothetical protein JOZ96_22390 [Acidobacteria bacterium]|nr:hypothetical protein [Acidobacteriota bacterium]
MRIFSATVKALTLAIVISVFASAANAQATRTWVSGVGADDNPCSRTAPCKTFAGAYSKTATGGEISVLDPAGYGTITIGKSITIDGGSGAGWASILASGVSGAIIVNPGAGGVVRLRNISINGNGTGTDGIRFLSGTSLHVENVRIFGFTGDGVELAFTGAAAGRLNARNLVISECGGSGVLAGGSNTLAHAIGLDNVNISQCGHGVRVNNRAQVRVSNSVITLINASASSTAVLADSAVVGGAIIDVVDSKLDYNSIAVQSNTNQAVRLSRTHIMGNANALNFTGGTIATYKNNEIAGNTSGENFASLTPINVQ